MADLYPLFPIIERALSVFAQAPSIRFLIPGWALIISDRSPTPALDLSCLYRIRNRQKSQGIA